ncbi:MAG: LysR family transcriptional regulator [Bauldia sp.]
MELRQLQHFLAIADTTSLSKASSILGIAQPALSRHLRLLEKELGVALFYRNGRGITITEEGERFRQIIEPLMRDLQQAKIEISSLALSPVGPVSCGMPPSISAVFGARLVMTFLERFPNATLHLVDGFSGYVNEWLVNGRLDMAVINSARRSPHLHMDPLMQVDLFHVANRKSVPPAERKDTSIPFAKVAEKRLILPGRHHGLRRELEAAASERRLKLDVFVEIDALNAAKELVQNDVGTTVLPHGAVINELNDSRLVVRRIVEPRVTNQYMIAYAGHRPLTLAMTQLANTLKSEVRSAIADGRLVGELPAAGETYQARHG